MIKVRETIIDTDGNAKQVGVDNEGSKPTLVGLNQRKKTAVFHEKGHSYWAGIGVQNYAGARVTVGTYEELRVERGKIMLMWFEPLVEYMPTKSKAVDEMKGVLAGIVEMESAPQQCEMCGCAPCECESLYPWCTHCKIFASGYTAEDGCPDCGGELDKKGGTAHAIQMHCFGYGILEP